VGLEEPESTIHPEALSSIVEMIRAFSRDTQVVATTQSPELLGAKWIQPENLRVVTWERGVTQVLPLGEASVGALKDHLMGAGELLRSNALQPRDFFAEEATGAQMELFGDVPS
jgi:hypothetical protein